MMSTRSMLVRWLGLAAVVALLARASPPAAAAERRRGQPRRPRPPGRDRPSRPTEEPPAEEPAAGGGGLGQRVRRRLGRRRHHSSSGGSGISRRPGIEPWMDEMVAAFQDAVPERDRRDDAVRDGHVDPDAADGVPVAERPGPLVQLDRDLVAGARVEGLHGPERGRPLRRRHRGQPAHPGDAVRGPDVGLPALPVRLPDRLQQDAVRAGRPRSGDARPTTWDDFIAALEHAQGGPGSRRSRSGSRTGSAARSSPPASSRSSGCPRPRTIKQLVIDGDFTTDRTGRTGSRRRSRSSRTSTRTPTRSASRKGSRSSRHGRPRWSPALPASRRSSRRCPDEGKQVGLLKAPPFDDGAWADSLVNTGNGFQVTQLVGEQGGRRRVPRVPAAAREPGGALRGDGQLPGLDELGSVTVTSQTDQQMLRVAGREERRPAGRRTTRPSTSTSTGRSSSSRRSWRARSTTADGSASSTRT